MYIVTTEIAGAVMDAIFYPQFDRIARYGNSSALFAAGCCPFISFKLHGVSYHQRKLHVMFIIKNVNKVFGLFFIHSLSFIFEGFLC